MQVELIFFSREQFHSGYDLSFNPFDRMLGITPELWRDKDMGYTDINMKLCSGFAM